MQIDNKMRISVPESCYVYEFSYPEGMGEASGAVFYVGKATHTSRLDAHLSEASHGCFCDKCAAIRSIWDAGLVVIRRIVFETPSSSDAFDEERRRIRLHDSPFLTNISRPNPPIKGEKQDESLDSILLRCRGIHPSRSLCTSYKCMGEDVTVVCATVEDDHLSVILKLTVPPHETFVFDRTSNNS